MNAHIPEDFSTTRSTVSQTKEGEFIFHDTTEEDFLGKWCDYFDFATDYSELKRNVLGGRNALESLLFRGRYTPAPAG